MKTKSLILLLGGASTRSNLDINKTLYQINNIPLFIYSLDKFYKLSFDEYILVVREEDKEEINKILENYPYDVKIVTGGARRCDSVKNGLKEVHTSCAFIHDAARPLVNINDIKSLINIMEASFVATLASKVSDTIRNINNNHRINRDDLLLISTPQAFDQTLFKDILNNDQDITDEISLFEDNYDIKYVIETSINPKLTYQKDLELIKNVINAKNYLIGHSLDYHPFKEDGSLLLGGIIFNDYPSLLGHSDADVIYHAVAEALLGACALGDLGTFYPDNIDATLGIKSSFILQDVVNKITNLGYTIQNIDVMVYLIKPNLSNYKKEMAKNIGLITGINKVCVKAATLNKKGLISLEEGIGAEATVLVSK